MSSGMLPGRTPLRESSGAASLELVILAPFLLSLLMLVIAFGRYAQTESLIDQAARDATRAATAQNERSQVQSVVDKVVKETLDDAPQSCRDSAKTDKIALSPNAFGLPNPNDPIAIDSVSVTVVCSVDMGDLAIVPLKSVQIERTFTSPLDRYRGYR